MSDWKFLNQHRYSIGMFGTNPTDGFNGAFKFPIAREARIVCAIASYQMGWKHVSVSFGPNKSIPSWEVMCKVKELFFEPDDWVIQFHPPVSQHINNHPGCLHLWQPDAEFPTPPSIMVGIKELGVIK